ncbi:hypothetical protein A8V01_09065 [Novosphingobium guangzhouense]|uniref:Zinc ribbon domain-containing protein n=2 Tax=Novosphingobium guangzhouense TaxID=1850347 RepID=A0A2K2FUP9_9SPHN|nr:hypothetical protein A8V01_09065 [Novosphingobium guangzhouense]
MIAFGLITTLFAVVGMAIARERGVDMLSGFCLGLLLGPFGLVGTYMLGSTDDRDEVMLKKGQRVRCNQCAELARPEAVVCPSCHHALAPAVE